MSVVVIGVDPGDSAGVGIIKDTELWHVFQGTPGDAMTLIELTVTNFHEEEHTVAIACERFVNLSSRGRTHQPTAQKVGGALEHLAEQHNVKFRFQGPADAHAIATNETLRQLGMFQTPSMIGRPDANDVNMAIRHALLYLSSTHVTLFKTMLERGGVIR